VLWSSLSPDVLGWRAIGPEFAQSKRHNYQRLAMRIAQVAPLYESVPPRLYGGTERVVSYLTEALVLAGHNVTLFASGDSITKARLIPGVTQALRLSTAFREPLVHHFLLLEQVFARAADFDVIHFHTDYLHFGLARRAGVPHLTTLHGRLDLPDLPPLYAEFGEIPVISISDNQREPLPEANWIGTVYHGLPRNLYRFNPGPGSYLAFLGRISPEKRLDLAIEIAEKAGMRLRVAAKVDRVDQDYFNETIKPLLSKPRVEFIGEINEQQKTEFLGRARALLFPIDWPEPFGLVMIEAMACGTPVIAFRRGSVPEIIEDKVTGFMVDNVDQAANAVAQVANLSRAQCRATFEERFCAERMAQDYLELYERVARTAAPRLVA
jgi:glycosyltransferase involved in cell wall biosynthesis